MPDAEGLVHVTAPAGTLTPGTEVLIINTGNGYVMSFTADNDGALGVLLPAIFPATISDRLLVTITTPDGNVVSFERSKYVAADGTTGIGSAGGTVVSADGAVELRIPDGALDEGAVFKLSLVADADLGALFPNNQLEQLLPGTNYGSALKIESSGNVVFKKGSSRK